MKRFTILFASIMMLFSLKANAQNQRVLLLESFTNTGCGPCAAYNPAMDALILQPTPCISTTPPKTVQGQAIIM